MTSSQEETEVNMTPMLDVVFILLIFFIVTATFLREFGLDINQPNESDEQESEVEAIFIQVDANEQVFFNQRPILVESVKANVQRRLAETPGAGVVVQNDREAKSGVVIRVMDQARAAGAAVSLKPAED
jgi:biopolymer transport protein ExbD